MENNHAETILDAGAAAGNIRTVEEGGIPFAVIPNDYIIAGLAPYLKNPVRKEGRASFSDLESFTRYVKAFADPQATIIAADLTENGATITAILDYHQPGGQAGWRQHQAVYACPPSIEWKRWRAQENRDLTQAEFAEFLENNLADIVRPDGATLLEIARTLQAKTTVNFASGIRLENGNEQLAYEETTEARAGEKGAFTIPSQFQLGIPVFVRGERYAVTGRLRYRIKDKKLSFRYQLINPHLVVNDACEVILGTVQQLTGIQPYRGTL